MFADQLGRRAGGGDGDLAGALASISLRHEECDEEQHPVGHPADVLFPSHVLRVEQRRGRRLRAGVEARGASQEGAPERACAVVPALGLLLLVQLQRCTQKCVPGQVDQTL